MSISRQHVLLMTVFTVLLVSFAVSPSLLVAWETPMVIAGKSGHSYEKPEIGFHPSGAVFIAYREKEPGGGNSDIIVCEYNGKEMIYHNASEAATFWPRHKCYEADLEITADGVVHVAWTGHDRNNPDHQFIMYRKYDGKNWSDVETIGDLHMHSGDITIDMRLGVDNFHNVHVILQEEHSVVIRYFAKYGDTKTGMINIGNPGSRLKHPDIAVNDNEVHVIWMRKIGFPYVIMHQKWENKIGGVKSEIRQITFPVGEYASQKSRIDLDSSGLMHLAEFYKKGTIKKLKYWKETTPGGAFAPYINMSSQSKLMLYHWAALEVRDNSVIASMQLGSSSGGTGIYYRWKKFGTWSSYAKIPGTEGPKHQSTDLSADGLVAATAYARYENAIMLTSSDPISASGTLETAFDAPTQVFWGTDVAFDASQCADLNPDFNILTYEWDFGDGTVLTTANPTITHKYEVWDTDFEVTLTITATTGESGVGTLDVHVDALYGATNISVTPKRIRTLFYNRYTNLVEFSPNPKNEASGFPTIANYEIWRARLSSSPSADDYQLLGQVDASFHKFLDYFSVEPNVNYVYSVVSVDSQGNRSPLNRQ